MSQSASNRCRFKRQLTQAVCILLTSLTTSVVWAEPGVIEILGPNGESVLAKPAPKRYGPVTPADTLWRIATASRPDESVTIYQTMYAFYVKNPQAFEQANIHKLSKNSYLVVPTIDEIRQYSDRQAMAQLRQDNESKLDAKPQSVPVTESTVTATTTPQILTPPLQESSAETTPEIASPMAATGTSDQSMATSEEETQERFEQERARKIDEAQMRQLKNDLADSIGSIEALLNQNQALTQRVETLSETIATLETALLAEQTKAQQAREELNAQALTTQQEVKNLIEKPPGVSSLWLWILSAGLAIVFALIGWLLLRHRHHSEPAVAQPVAPMPEAVAAAEELAAEPDDVLLDLGLGETDLPDEPIDLEMDVGSDSSLIDLDQLELGDELSVDLDDEQGIELGDDDDIEDLLASDVALTKPKEEKAPPQMKEIHTLDLDLDSEGGELTQEALDALADMDSFAEGDDSPSLFDEHENDAFDEAFDAIGKIEEPDSAIDEAVVDAILSGMDESEDVTESAKSEKQPDSSDILDADDIDALLAEANNEEAVEEPVKFETPNAESLAETDTEDSTEELELPEVDQEEVLIPESLSLEDETVVDIDSLLDDTQAALAINEDELADESVNISTLLTETQSPKVAEAKSEPVDLKAMTADELEAEFDLANFADELLAEEQDDAVEDDFAIELEPEGSLSDRELATQLAELEAEVDSAIPAVADDEVVSEDFLDIDQLLAEADSTPGMTDDDQFLPSDLDDAEELEDEDDVAAKLDLARAYIEIGDTDIAAQLLKEIIDEGIEPHKGEAEDLLTRLS